MHIISTNLLKRRTMRGALFSFEALIAGTLILLILFLFMQTITKSYLERKENVEHFYLEEKTLMVADALVKNYNKINPLLGACSVDPATKRVKSNQLSGSLLSQAQPFALKEFFVKQLNWGMLPGQTNILSTRDSNNCIAAKRFVLIDGIKSTVTVVGCLTDA